MKMWTVPKIKVPIYTTDIDILRVASMHRIVRHHIDESLIQFNFQFKFICTALFMIQSLQSKRFTGN